MKKIVSLLALALLTMSAWAANTYVKVTSLEQLVAGQKYILVNEDNSRAMGPIAGTSTTYGSYVGITITDGIIDIEGTDVVELTADEGGTYSNGPTWHFTYDDGAYMFWNSGNSLSSISSDVANLLSGVKWVPALTTDGVILKNNGDISRILQYNASSPRFACYTSAQKPAVLYVQDASVTPPVTVAAPTLPESQEFENSLSVTITNNEEGADLMYALNDGEFTAYSEALTITETTTVHAKAVKGDVESEVVSATYTKVEPVVYTKPYVKVNSVDELTDVIKIIINDNNGSLEKITYNIKGFREPLVRKVNVSDSESAQRFIDNITKDPSKKEYLTELYNLSEYRDTTISASSEEKLNKILKELTDKGYVLNE